MNTSCSWFIRFPENPSVRKQWSDFCGVTEIAAGKKLCAKHFEKENIIERKSPNGGSSTYRLKKDAVPNLCPEVRM